MSTEQDPLLNAQESNDSSPAVQKESAPIHLYYIVVVSFLVNLCAFFSETTMVEILFELVCWVYWHFLGDGAHELFPGDSDKCVHPSVRRYFTMLMTLSGVMESRAVNPRSGNRPKNIPSTSAHHGHEQQEVGACGAFRRMVDCGGHSATPRGTDGRTTQCKGLICRRAPKGSASPSSMARRMCGMVVAGRKEKERSTVARPRSLPCPKRACAACGTLAHQTRHWAVFRRKCRPSQLGGSWVRIRQAKPQAVGRTASATVPRSGPSSERLAPRSGPSGERLAPRSGPSGECQAPRPAVGVWGGKPHNHFPQNDLFAAIKSEWVLCCTKPKNTPKPAKSSVKSGSNESGGRELFWNISLLIHDFVSCPDSDTPTSVQVSTPEIVDMLPFNHFFTSLVSAMPYPPTLSDLSLNGLQLLPDDITDNTEEVFSALLPPLETLHLVKCSFRDLFLVVSTCMMKDSPNTTAWKLQSLALKGVPMPRGLELRSFSVRKRIGEIK
ncbi:hypothetical protein B0H10DRAFT_1954545 [Mycena sp. CBHHK59/15]|nr:hypothetical protein B0H10DRAFT_1954545 [Mycena sp. CBHHK59/15]